MNNTKQNILQINDFNEKLAGQYQIEESIFTGS